MDDKQRERDAMFSLAFSAEKKLLDVTTAALHASAAINAQLQRSNAMERLRAALLKVAMKKLTAESEWSQEKEVELTNAKNAAKVLSSLVGAMPGLSSFISNPSVSQPPPYKRLPW